ncbi:MAG: oligosaccharide flippase family protein [Candidatus Odinarchaeum yellowstonii]|uniref:Oligosaccharide flippase family protein n=1 Tax=Odinarchaeota yellowstonii (strain LCB_4) TaxID=1841599 RepID=A0AAF0IBB3_ODILC|nr:MAG: oligosaccharide flippase family protein [Candidatus Odinarchaeum yellowstonii]
MNLELQGVKSIFSEFKTDLLGKVGFKTSTLYLSQVLALILGAATGVINTRVLGPDGYGLFTFFFSFTTFIVIFFRFGFFNAAGLLVAQVKSRDEEREIIGSSIIVAFIIGVSYSLTIFILSFFIDQIFKTNIGLLMRYLSFLLIPLPLQLLIPNLARGTSRVSMLAAFYVLPSTIYLIGAVILTLLMPVQTYHFILLNTFSIIFCLLIILYLFNPAFTNIKNNINKIFKKTKEYGFHIYSGQVVDQSTAKLGEILIPYYVTTSALGFYSLASTLLSPMIALPSSVSITLFKDFVKMKTIPNKIILYILGWLTLCTIILYSLGEFIVTLLFGEPFISVYYFILPLVLAGFFKGIYQPYLMFLSAKEKGRWVRNSSFAMGLVYIACDIILIPVIGVYGAITADIIASFTFFILVFIFYKKYLGALNAA